MKELMLQVSDLRYTYQGSQAALKGVDLNIYKGERLAVLGSNGSGKSTFFLNLNGVLTPDHGQICYNGRKITKKDLNELRKNIGIVFQDADDQIIASTVLAEVSFGPMNLKLPKDEVRQRVEEALDYMNISSFKDRPPHYLSGGEKKRVSIADIIAMKPEVIIFDEPTAALDPLNADMLEAVLEKLAKVGKTTLISTHDMDFAYRWAERVVVFHEGRILADGDPATVFQDENVVKTANLKRPVLMEVYEALVESGMVQGGKEPPRDLGQFRNLIFQTVR